MYLQSDHANYFHVNFIRVLINNSQHFIQNNYEIKIITLI